MKGPSAATLYGTDAANGVIVITTKKGTRRRDALDLVRRRRQRRRPQHVSERRTRSWGHDRDRRRVDALHARRRSRTGTLHRRTACTSFNLLLDDSSVTSDRTRPPRPVRRAGERRQRRGALLRQRRPRERDRPGQDAGVRAAALDSRRHDPVRDEWSQPRSAPAPELPREPQRGALAEVRPQREHRLHETGTSGCRRSTTTSFSIFYSALQEPGLPAESRPSCSTTPTSCLGYSDAEPRRRPARLRRLHAGADLPAHR